LRWAKPAAIIAIPRSWPVSNPAAEGLIRDDLRKAMTNSWIVSSSTSVAAVTNVSSASVTNGVSAGPDWNDGIGVPYR
jgi:hypothetical protein